MTELEQKILRKLYEYYSEYGDIANIDDWINDLSISRLELSETARGMYEKGWLRYYADKGNWGGILSGISLEGMRVIGKKPIDFVNEVKKCELKDENENLYLLITFYNTRQEKYYFASDEYKKLKEFALKEGYTGYVEIYEWLKINRKDILEILLKYNNAQKLITNLIDCIQSKEK